MKPETRLLSKKYCFALALLQNERELFFDENKNIIYEHYFNTRLYIIWLYSQIKVPYRNVINTRTKIIKNFEIGKNKIYIKYFKLCHDISDYILSFLF